MSSDIKNEKPQQEQAPCKFTAALRAARSTRWKEHNKCDVLIWKTDLPLGLGTIEVWLEEDRYWADIHQFSDRPPRPFEGYCSNIRAHERAAVLDVCLEMAEDLDAEDANALLVWAMRVPLPHAQEEVDQ